MPLDRAAIDPSNIPDKLTGMMHRRRLKRLLSTVVDSLMLVVIGGDMTLTYLRSTGPGSAQIDHLASIVSSAFWLLLWISILVRPRRDTIQSGDSLSPRWSGTAVVVATGSVAVFSLGRGSISGADPIAALMVAIGTVIVAALVWRFATAHANEIGEARFDTSGTSAPRM